MTLLEDRLDEAVEARKSAADSRTFARARAREQVLRERVMEEAIGNIEAGAFHRWLGKPLDEPITDADIAKGLAAGGHPAKMANFARNFRNRGGKKKKAALRESDWLDAHAEEWLPTEAQLQLEETAKTAGYSVTPSPFSTSKTSNWVARVGGLPAYIQNVAKGIMKSGKAESSAIASAIAVCKRWASGGGNVSQEVQAAAAKAIAQWEAKKAASHAK